MIPAFLQVDIPRRSSCCEKGGERLTPGMEYYSLLVEQDDKKFLRHDFCAVCWQASFNKEEEGSIGRGYWKSRIEIKKETASPNLSRIEKAFACLQELVKQPEGREAELFVLSLFLARARQIVLRQEWEQEGYRYFLYEHPQQETFITIKQVDIPVQDIERIQQALAEKLNTAP